jgi:hypothetical protein
MIKTTCDICCREIREPYPREVHLVQNSGAVRLGHLCDIHSTQLKLWMRGRMAMVETPAAL